MFTGLIHSIGTVTGRTKESITVEAKALMKSLKVGDSVAVDGVCLTVSKKDARSFTADVMPETFKKTTLGGRKYGDPVNLEPALKVGDALGGHMVSGHVDGTARVATIKADKDFHVITFVMASMLTKYAVPKGSIAINGVSLTVNQVAGQRFTLNLIPHTLEMTTLKHLKPGSRVNLEVDLLARYCERLLGVSDSVRCSPSAP